MHSASLALLGALVSLVSPAATAPAKPAAFGSALPLDRLFADPPLEGTAPQGVSLSPAARFVGFLRGSDVDSEVQDLWVARLPQGNPTLVVRASTLLSGETQRLTEQERMQLERKRIQKRGVTSYRWCGDAGDAVLFPFSGDLYLARLDDDGGLDSLTRLTHDERVPELSPRCSPGGRFVSYVKGGDVVVIDLTAKGFSAGRERRLTHGATETRTFGLAEFIAEEEMGRHDGMFWSDDDTKLLVLEIDESQVKVKTRAQIFADRTEVTRQRYPAAGEANARVRAHVIDVRSGRDVVLATPNEDGYLARAGFFPDGHAWVQWQTRDQHHVRVLEQARPVAGALHLILDESDPVWVDLHDDMKPLKDGARFLWSSERSGTRQLYVVTRQTGAVLPLTRGAEAVVSVAGVDDHSAEDGSGTVFFLGYADRGRQQQLFAVPLTRGGGSGGEARVITPEPGWHTATLDDTARVFVDVASDFGVPPHVSLRSTDGRTLSVIDANPAPELAAKRASEPQWLDVRADDGTVLNGLLLPPTDLPTGGRAPVLVSTYGGPHGQTVARRWAKTHPFFVHLNQRGYGVFLLDNRGMAGRDRAFARAIRERFGDVEVRDLRAGVAALREVPWVDGSRIGVFGWSYGGYLSARAILDDDTPFAAAIAVAPVTDWTLYDTHYTERYLGMPRGAGDAYARASLLPRAKMLRKPLLVMHGTADDNVLFEHTLRLTEALEAAGQPFDLMIYPGKAHGIGGRAAQRHVYTTIMRFLDRTLTPLKTTATPAR